MNKWEGSAGIEFKKLNHICLLNSLYETAGNLYTSLKIRLIILFTIRTSIFILCSQFC